ncbi:unnamed protein product [Phytomonas sp. EM1]|nr:unnamed protein product [Phytomonas sp. EM1]|eukprot:CCW60275.1 unnamed protein product [Phytomonas sp. isolate EM1]
MVLLGQQQGSVMSLTSSFADDMNFASLGSDGSVTLWDTRLKKAMHMCIPNPVGDVDAGEVLLVPDRHLAITLCGNLIQFFDIRTEIGVVASDSHSCEVVRFLGGAHPPGRSSTLIVDEEGFIMPLDLIAMRKSHLLGEFVFGRPIELIDGGFGSLSNYSSGLGLVMEGTEGKGLARRALFSLGMDGRGCLLSGPAPTERRDFTLGYLGIAEVSTLFNPPLANCCGFGGDGRVAIGRADGTYIVCEVTEGEGVEELMTAPGHAVNGLCHVDFLSNGSLLTVSLCGQITVWDVPSFLLGDDNAETDGELPKVQCALDHRECAESPTSVINCASALGSVTLLTGDADGRVVSSNLEEC